jgi:oligopeptide transport system substrate-binding protein
MGRKPKLAYVSLAIIALVTLIGSACAGPAGTTTTGIGNTPQVLRLNLAGEPNLIDPSRMSWTNESTVIKQVFVGLLGFNADLTLKPVVAKEIPTVANKGISADGKTYTFNLKSNVTWSDGKKVTAKDFEYSIKRMLSPEIAADYASFYFAIAGAQDYNAAADKDAATKDKLKAAVGVKATNDATLQITLADVSPTFLQVMALPQAYPLREDVITANGDKWTEPPNYIGNGPFILTEWVHQDHLTLKANPNYWGAKPKLSEIQLKEITDINASLAAYKNNELDMTTVQPGTEKTIMADPVLSKEIVRFNDLGTYGLTFNLAVPPFDNLKVRQAMEMAIDRDAFIDKVRNGVGKPATSWIPPGMPGYDASLGTQYKFDKAKAKQLLSDAGYSDVSKLPPIKFQYADSAGNKTIAQFMQAQLKDNLGIDLILEPMETKAFQAAYNAKQFTMKWGGWIADYPDPENWLPELYGTGTGNNKQSYSNKQFDDIAKQAKVELDNTKRLQLWAQAQKIVVDDAPVLFINYRERFQVRKPWVKGMITTGIDGAIIGDQFWDQVYIQK